MLNKPRKWLLIWFIAIDKQVKVVPFIVADLDHSIIIWYLKCFSQTVFFSLTCYIMLHLIQSLLTFALSHSLPSKCWHISFKCSVFIIHSLFPPSPISPGSLRRSWVCLRGINPQTTTSLLLFLCFSLLLSFSSNCLIRLLLSAVGCQRTSILDSIPQAALWLPECSIL